MVCKCNHTMLVVAHIYSTVFSLSDEGNLWNTISLYNVYSICQIIYCSEFFDSTSAIDSFSRLLCLLSLIWDTCVFSLAEQAAVNTGYFKICQEKLKFVSEILTAVLISLLPWKSWGSELKTLKSPVPWSWKQPAWSKLWPRLTFFVPLNLF